MSKRSIRRIVTEIIVIGILVFLIVFCVGFRVTKVEVKGNQFYSDEEIKKMVLDVPAAKNTLLAERFINTEEKTKEEALIERITIKRKKWNTLVLQVREKQMIGYFSLNGQCLNFDRQGVIQIITEEPIENVPLIDGLNVKEAKQGEKIKGINKKRLNTILSVGKMLEKTEQKPDRLVFNDLKQLVLYYGSIEVNMGSDENMDEKMNRLIGILPQLEGMEGVLHLENVTEDTASVVFDNAAEENSEAGQSAEEENTDTNTSEEEDGQDISDADSGEGTDSADQGEDSQNSDSQDKDTEDKGTSSEGDSDTGTDVEYSDGSDSAG
ncbi:cell division protein FtsQ/DivIB [Blautia sp.]|uniref:cell division protein FtsQ/DivIB n=1 Tax=Blautia sp. TaxID=1955243 RepID=UPI0025C24724|nr:cell division protein FtsQ/DivIB [Blautia sp.]